MFLLGCRITVALQSEIGNPRHGMFGGFREVLRYCLHNLYSCRSRRTSKKLTLLHDVLETSDASLKPTGFADSALGLALKKGRLTPSSQQPLEDTIQSTVRKYLSDPIADLETTANLIGWWKIRFHDYPGLSQLALIYATLPATSISSEQVKLGSQLVSNRECNLVSKAIEASVCLNVWNTLE